MTKTIYTIALGAFVALVASCKEQASSAASSATEAVTDAAEEVAPKVAAPKASK